jgi:Spy/CpxP family protein refolding chaperone
MKSRLVQISAIAAACLIATGVRADDNADKPNKKGGDRPHKDGDHKPDGKLPKFALAHAADLNLTDEQKQKLEAMVKFMEEHRAADGDKKPEGGVNKPEGLERILTDEQKAKLKELLMAERGDRPDKPKKGRPDGDKKPRPDGEKK